MPTSANRILFLCLMPNLANFNIFVQIFVTHLATLGSNVPASPLQISFNCKIIDFNKVCSSSNKKKHIAPAKKRRGTHRDNKNSNSEWKTHIVENKRETFEMCKWQAGKFVVAWFSSIKKKLIIKG